MASNEVAVAPKRALSAELISDFEALRNDVQQANELAFDFQRQLAGKSNDFAMLKQVFEKTREDLGRLQADITALREDRHRLANEAMKGQAYQMKLGTVTTERDRLRIDLEVIRSALAASERETAGRLLERDKQIAELTVENAVLKQALAEAQRKAAPSAPGSPVQSKSDTGAAKPLPKGDDEGESVDFGS